MVISVREWEKNDIVSIVEYFINSDAEFLKGMGADKKKLPAKEEWIAKLNLEISKPNKDKEFYYIIWMIDGEPVGHSNINNIDFGNSATMHLHLWENATRKKGLGFEFVKRTVPYYFQNFKLEKLICEPMANNIAPNKIMKRIGFDFIKEYETIPGWINFKQLVARYEMTRKQTINTA